MLSSPKAALTVSRFALCVKTYAASLPLGSDQLYQIGTLGLIFKTSTAPSIWRFWQTFAIMRKFFPLAATFGHEQTMKTCRSVIRALFVHGVFRLLTLIRPICRRAIHTSIINPSGKLTFGHRFSGAEGILPAVSNPQMDVHLHIAVNKP